MKKFTNLISVFIVSTVFFGCSAKKSDELFNLTPNQWYSEIMKDIKDLDLDAADKHFVSFSSEHVASPLLEETTLILAQANIDEENYTRANDYLNEYIKRFGTEEKIEFARFMKIKANFDSFSKPNRNQKLMKNSINEIKLFSIDYPKSKYRPLVDTMLLKLKLADHQLDKEILDLYERTGRKESAEFYSNKIENSVLKDTEAIKPTSPWYRRVFE